MPLKVFSQLDFAENGLIDDCGLGSLAMAIHHSSKGLVSPGVKACIDAATKAGRVDRFGKSDPTTFVQMVAAGKLLGATVAPAPSWAAAVAGMRKGQGAIVALSAHNAIPAHALSAWQRSNMKRRPGHSYSHAVALAIVDGKFYLADPTLSGKGKEAEGVEITEGEARTLAHWGIQPVNAKRPRPMLWLVSVKIPKTAPAPVLAPAEAIVPIVELPSPKPVAAPKAVEPTVTPKPTVDPSPSRKTAKAGKSAYEAELAALGRVNWDAVGDEAGKLLARGLEETKGKKMIDRIKWIIANTGIDEAAAESLRVGLSSGLAVMLATGAPLLDMSTQDFRTVGSAALAAMLQVIVRALNPEDQKFGIGRAKAVRAAEKTASGVAR
jgi:hypothetical protein